MTLCIRLFCLFALVLCLSQQVASLGQSLADCKTVASSFASTCTTPGVPESNIIKNAGTTVSCRNMTNCPGVTTNGVCTWQRKICVTCSNSTGTTRIRVQTNILPPYCYLSGNTVVNETNIDWEVNFNPIVSQTSPRYTFTSQTGINNILCNFVGNSAPATSNFTNHGSSQPTMFAVATNGILMFNSLDIDKHDPLYPPSGYTGERTDTCLGHPDAKAIYHYHSTSPCIGNTSLNATSITVTNATKTALAGWANKKTQTVAGLAVDGHVLNGYYYSSGQLVQTGFDACNGVFLSDGSYQYFSTTTFPYFVGCLGPANYPTVFPNCTSNPPSAYAPLSSTSTSVSYSPSKAATVSTSHSAVAVSPSSSKAFTQATASNSASQVVGSSSVSPSSLVVAQTSSSTTATSFCLNCRKKGCKRYAHFQRICGLIGGTFVLNSSSSPNNFCCNSVTVPFSFSFSEGSVTSCDSVKNTKLNKLCAGLGGTEGCATNARRVRITCARSV